MIQYVFAIDPGTGSSSPAAVAFFDAKNQEVIWSADIWPLGYKPSSRKDRMLPHVRIKMIFDQITKLWEQTVAEYPLNRIGVCTENFVMQGKGGATLQQMRGAVLCIFPLSVSITEVNNKTMKKVAGGHGGADKEQIGEFLIKALPKSAEVLKELLDLEAWDQIDAIGLAYAAEFK